MAFSDACVESVEGKNGEQGGFQEESVLTLIESEAH
jgi:hypothetical protein